MRSGGNDAAPRARGGCVARAGIDRDPGDSPQPRRHGENRVAGWATGVVLVGPLGESRGGAIAGDATPLDAGTVSHRGPATKRDPCEAGDPLCAPELLQVTA